LIESVVFSSDGKQEQRITYKYHFTRNVTEEITYDSKGAISLHRAFKYEFDDQLNWVKQIEYYNYEPSFVVYRDVVYFK
jgi:hypothetical protein